MSRFSAFLFVLFVTALVSCNNEAKGPDVSGIKINLEVKRFDRDFFAIDSNHAKEGLEKLLPAYPSFLPIFTGHVLGLGNFADTNTLLYTGTKRFLSLNQRVFDTAQIVFKSTTDLKEALVTGFQHVKYYFPGYQLPVNIYTTVGPMDALAPMSNNEPSPNYMGTDFLAIGLQFYLGKDYSIYNDPDYAAGIVPQFRSRRFSKEYIASDVFRLVLDDLFPDNSSRLPLIEKFVEKGKRVAVLKMILPSAPDSIITGYTNDQLNWCEENERSILNFFTQQNLLYEIDPSLTQNYINDGPFTQGMPQESPGNIGLFLGWQIVKAYMKKHPETTPAQLMKLPAKEIFNASTYKPR